MSSTILTFGEFIAFKGDWRELRRFWVFLRVIFRNLRKFRHLCSAVRVPPPEIPRHIIIDTSL